MSFAQAATLTPTLGPQGEEKLLKIAFRAMFLGPLVGAFFYLAWQFVVPQPSNPSAHTDISGGLAMAFFLAFVSYPFAFLYGAVPAIVAGAAYWAWLKYKTEMNPSWPIRALLGAGSGLCSCLIISALLFLVGASQSHLGSMVTISLISCLTGALIATSATDVFYRNVFPERAANSRP